MIVIKRALLLALMPATVFAAPVFTLHSPDFSDHSMLNKIYAGNNSSNPSCSGENISPALNWQNPPPGTRSYALMMTDPVGGKGLGVTHMVAYNIAATRTQFAQNELSKGIGYTGGKNSPGTSSYYGPCPPAGSGVHNYNFVIVATDLAADALPANLTHEELISKLKGHALAASTIIGRFTNDQ